MGGKRRGNVRQQKRAADSATELYERTTTAGRVVENKEDVDLFMIDDVGNTRLSNRLQSEARKKKTRHPPKELSRKVNKLLKKNGKEAVIRLAARERPNHVSYNDHKKYTKKQKTTNTNKNKDQANFDLWDDGGATRKTKLVPVTRGVGPSVGGTAPIRLAAPSGDLVPSQKQLKARDRQKTIAVEVAGPGQSYRPDKEQHQEAIGEALHIEIRRNDAIRYNATPLIADSVDVQNQDNDDKSDSDSDDTASDSDSDDTMDDTSTTTNATHIQKRPTKLTRAQRHRQRRDREQTLQAQARKKQRRFLHDITESRKHAKAVVQDERVLSEKQTVRQKLLEEKRATPMTTERYYDQSMDARKVPALPVALTDELASLRAIQPKGSLVVDRLHSLTARSMANAKNKRKKNEMKSKKRKSIIRGNF